MAVIYRFRNPVPHVVLILSKTQHYNDPGRDTLTMLTGDGRVQVIQIYIDLLFRVRVMLVLFAFERCVKRCGTNFVRMPPNEKVCRKC